jgi:hypothetical protein
VEYGVSASYETSSSVDDDRRTTHQVALDGLSPSTVYHFRVRSVDGSGNEALSSASTFTTATAFQITDLQIVYPNHATALQVEFTTSGPVEFSILPPGGGAMTYGTFPKDDEQAILPMQSDPQLTASMAGTYRLLVSDFMGNTIATQDFDISGVDLVFELSMTWQWFDEPLGYTLLSYSLTLTNLGDLPAPVWRVSLRIGNLTEFGLFSFSNDVLLPGQEKVYGTPLGLPRAIPAGEYLCTLMVEDCEGNVVDTASTLVDVP